MTRDRAGRWHGAFAAIRVAIEGPGTGEVVGLDRGVVVAAALSTGELLHAPTLTARERSRLRRLERRLARAQRGPRRRRRVRLALVRLRARETDRRKYWAEKASTGIARRFDVVRVEDLTIAEMTRSVRGMRENPGRNVRQKPGLTHEIRRSGWGLLVHRRARESRAVFRCTACGYVGNADVNAARNIAAGHVVTARGGGRGIGPVNREPQLLASLAERE